MKMGTAMRKTTAPTPRFPAPAAWPFMGKTSPVVVKHSRLRDSRVRATHALQRASLVECYAEPSVRPPTNPLACLFDDTAEYLGSNMIDPDGDLDGSVEFGDATGEEDEMVSAGLTIFTPRNVLDAGSFLNGYSVGIDEPFPTW
jgi:hypothetical protein